MITHEPIDPPTPIRVRTPIDAIFAMAEKRRLDVECGGGEWSVTIDGAEYWAPQAVTA